MPRHRREGERSFVFVGGGVGKKRKNLRREKCAGREDALVAAASDSISMNFQAEAAAP